MSDMTGKENYGSKRIRSIYRTDTQGKSNDTGTASSMPESHRQSCQPLGEGNGISGYPDTRTFGREALGVTLTELMKCQKMQQQEVSVQDTDAVIEAGIDIAKYQQKMQRKKMMQGFGLIVVGAFVIFNAVYLHASVTFSAILPNSADGPTAVFYAGKLGDVKPYIWGMVGVAAIAGGIIRIIRGRR